MRQVLWLIIVLVLVCGWPERTTVVADAQDKQEPSKQGNGAEPAPEKDKKGHYANIEMVGVLHEDFIHDEFEFGNFPPMRQIWSVRKDKLACRLDFQGQKELLALAVQQKGKTVLVTGSLESALEARWGGMGPPHLLIKVVTLRAATND